MAWADRRRPELPARQIGSNPRSSSLQAIDVEAPFHGRDPVRQPRQTGAPPDVNSPDPVVDDLDDETAIDLVNKHVGRRRSGMFGYVGQSFTHDEVGRRFE